MKKIILVYHQINEDDLFMSASLEQFIMQMEYLKSKKFKFCNLKELLHEQSGNNVCVMFDDCYSSIKPAVNYMKERQLKYGGDHLPSISFLFFRFCYANGRYFQIWFPIK